MWPAGARQSVSGGLVAKGNDDWQLAAK